MLSSYPLRHDDYVLDLAFDHSGRRIATCSVDQKIRVWEKKPKSLHGPGGAPSIGQSSAMSEGEPEGVASQIVFEWELVEELSKSAGHSAAVQRV
jgi:WD40 repeat protein